jgi:hypothetical protein
MCTVLKKERRERERERERDDRLQGSSILVNVAEWTAQFIKGVCKLRINSMHI